MLATHREYRVFARKLVSSVLVGIGQAVAVLSSLVKDRYFAYHPTVLALVAHNPFSWVVQASMATGM